MHNAILILGMLGVLAVGGAGGYYTGVNAANANNKTVVAEMADMMKTDGTQMAIMGGLMLDAGALMESKGAFYKDDMMVTLGKDLSANGMKHKEDGMSMTGGDMMGMTKDGNIDDMEGMNHGTP